MKTIVLGILVLTLQIGIAQNIAYIETEKIIEKMPAYQQASAEIEAQIKLWEEEVEAKFKKVEDMYQDYVKNETLFPDDIKQEKQQEIIDTEKQAKEFREQKFGREGELEKLQESKLKSFQDTILQTAERIGKEKNYDYVFEKSSESNWIYTNPKHDLTELVIAELGLNK
ncbi:MAG: OmpH family outer membrane protein [Bacteroidales bacterium]|nr:OmpH family outer membrane protein [Bacteroidales bacterium]